MNSNPPLNDGLHSIMNDLNIDMEQLEAKINEPLNEDDIVECVLLMLKNKKELWDLEKENVEGWNAFSEEVFKELEVKLEVDFLQKIFRDAKETLQSCLRKYIVEQKKSPRETNSALFTWNLYSFFAYYRAELKEYEEELRLEATTEKEHDEDTFGVKGADQGTTGQEEAAEDDSFASLSVSWEDYSSVGNEVDDSDEQLQHDTILGAEEPTHMNEKMEIGISGADQGSDEPQKVSPPDSLQAAASFSSDNVLSLEKQSQSEIIEACVHMNEKMDKCTQTTDLVTVEVGEKNSLASLPATRQATASPPNRVASPEEKAAQETSPSGAEWPMDEGMDDSSKVADQCAAFQEEDVQKDSLALPHSQTTISLRKEVVSPEEQVGHDTSFGGAGEHINESMDAEEVIDENIDGDASGEKLEAVQQQRSVESVEEHSLSSLSDCRQVTASPPNQVASPEENVAQDTSFRAEEPIEGMDDSSKEADQCATFQEEDVEKDSLALLPSQATTGLENEVSSLEEQVEHDTSFGGAGELINESADAKEVIDENIDDDASGARMEADEQQRSVESVQEHPHALLSGSQQATASPPNQVASSEETAAQDTSFGGAEEPMDEGTDDSSKEADHCTAFQEEAVQKDSLALLSGSRQTTAYPDNPVVSSEEQAPSETLINAGELVDKNIGDDDREAQQEAVEQQAFVESVEELSLALLSDSGQAIDNTDNQVISSEEQGPSETPINAGELVDDNNDGDDMEAGQIPIANPENQFAGPEEKAAQGTSFGGAGGLINENMDAKEVIDENIDDDVSGAKQEVVEQQRSVESVQEHSLSLLSGSLKAVASPDSQVVTSEDAADQDTSIEADVPVKENVGDDDRKAGQVPIAGPENPAASPKEKATQDTSFGGTEGQMDEGMEDSSKVADQRAAFQEEDVQKDSLVPLSDSRQTTAYPDSQVVSSEGAADQDASIEADEPIDTNIDNNAKGAKQETVEGQKFVESVEEHWLSSLSDCRQATAYSENQVASPEEKAAQDTSFGEAGENINKSMDTKDSIDENIDEDASGEKLEAVEQQRSMESVEELPVSQQATASLPNPVASPEEKAAQEINSGRAEEPMDEGMDDSSEEADECAIFQEEAVQKDSLALLSGSRQTTPNPDSQVVGSEGQAHQETSIEADEPMDENIVDDASGAKKEAVEEQPIVESVEEHSHSLLFNSQKAVASPDNRAVSSEGQVHQETSIEADEPIDEKIGDDDIKAGQVPIALEKAAEQVSFAPLLGSLQVTASSVDPNDEKVADSNEKTQHDLAIQAEESKDEKNDDSGIESVKSHDEGHPENKQTAPLRRSKRTSSRQPSYCPPRRRKRFLSPVGGVMGTMNALTLTGSSRPSPAPPSLQNSSCFSTSGPESTTSSTSSTSLTPHPTSDSTSSSTSLTALSTTHPPSPTSRPASCSTFEHHETSTTSNITDDLAEPMTQQQDPISTTDETEAEQLEIQYTMTYSFLRSRKQKLPKNSTITFPDDPVGSICVSPLPGYNTFTPKTYTFDPVALRWNKFQEESVQKSSRASPPSQATTTSFTTTGLENKVASLEEQVGHDTNFGGAGGLINESVDAKEVVDENMNDDASGAKQEAVEEQPIVESVEEHSHALLSNSQKAVANIDSQVVSSEGAADQDTSIEADEPVDENIGGDGTKADQVPIASLPNRVACPEEEAAQDRSFGGAVGPKEEDMDDGVKAANKVTVEQQPVVESVEEHSLALLSGSQQATASSPNRVTSSEEKAAQDTSFGGTEGLMEEGMDDSSKVADQCASFQEEAVQIDSLPLLPCSRQTTVYPDSPVVRSEEQAPSETLINAGELVDEKIGDDDMEAQQEAVEQQPVVESVEEHSLALLSDSRQATANPDSPVVSSEGASDQETSIEADEPMDENIVDDNIKAGQVPIAVEKAAEQDSLAPLPGSLQATASPVDPIDENLDNGDDQAQPDPAIQAEESKDEKNDDSGIESVKSHDERHPENEQTAPLRRSKRSSSRQPSYCPPRRRKRFLSPVDRVMGTMEALTLTGPSRPPPATLPASLASHPYSTSPSTSPTAQSTSHSPSQTSRPASCSTSEHHETSTTSNITDDLAEPMTQQQDPNSTTDETGAEQLESQCTMAYSFLRSRKRKLPKNSTITFPDDPVGSICVSPLPGYNTFTPKTYTFDPVALRWNKV